jgi:multiple antibiotic resistance protein
VIPNRAGAAILTTILSLRTSFHTIEIIAGTTINLAVIFFVLKSTPFVEKKLAKPATEAMRKVFGILLLAIAIQMFRTNVGI